MALLGGPMFEAAEDNDMRSVHGKRGGHYNIFEVKQGRMLAVLQEWFPNGEGINEMNFVLFSTSGVHGTYATIEEVEASLVKYGETPTFDVDGEVPDDYVGPHLTVMIVQPRLVAIRYGNISHVTVDDLPFLKKLRAASWNAVQQIGRNEASDV